MNEEKKNQNYFKETFREVHAPQALAERVMNMEELKTKNKKNIVVKRLAIAAAVAVVLFAGSNGIAYAMTGSTWLETIFTGPSAELIVEDDRVYIVDGDTEIDVTEALEKDGFATGSYEKNGYTKTYYVSNKNGQHVMDIRYNYDGIDVEEGDGRLAQSVIVIAGTPTPTPEP